ncbi:MAG: ATP12 family chaperone protein, partial [Pseudomonadota bacterium]
MKRFFKDVTTTADAGGFSIALDGKSVRTPSGAALALPTQALADAVAREWDAAGETITPAQLPLTQLCNTAIDRTQADMAAVIEAISAYIETDLLCYRADAPASLVEAQQTQWDPPLVWLKEACAIALTTTTDLLGHSQDSGARTALETILAD